MVERVAGEPLYTDLHEKLAIRAWQKLPLANGMPNHIEILKGKPAKDGRKLKRIVCRLAGIDPGGSAVIGKRCRPAQAIVEDTIYQNILPNLPFPSLNYYGMVKETNSEYIWIFVQDAGEESYSAQLEEHRLLKSEWLALMHTSAMHLGAPKDLPDKGPKQYLKRLQSARNAIQSYLTDHHGLQDSDLLPLQSIIDQCDLLESRGYEVEALCEGLPWTLVHGDFKAKNLRLRQDNDQMVLLTFDWGEAGWGTPATDIMQVDTNFYCLTVRDNWPWLNGKLIENSAKAGKVFRCLDAIYWELSGLKYEGSRALSCLRIYESRLADALQEAKLEY